MEGHAQAEGKSAVFVKLQNLLSSHRQIMQIVADLLTQIKMTNNI